MKCYYHKISGINKEEILKSTREFNKIKNKIENKVLNSKDEINYNPLAKDAITDAFVDALLVYEGKSNFGAYFSTTLKNYRKNQNYEIECAETKIEDKYFVEENFIKIKKELEKIIRELKPRRKFYFCLRNLINFEKPKDEIENKINKIVKKIEDKITYKKIGELFAINFNKRKPSKQGVEDALKRAQKEVVDKIKNNEKIKELLKEILY